MLGNGRIGVAKLVRKRRQRVTVVNRTFEKAQQLAERFNGDAKPLSQLQCALLEADILISSTGAKQYVITKETMAVIEKCAKVVHFYD